MASLISVKRSLMVLLPVLFIQGCPLTDSDDDSLIGHLTGPAISGLHYQTNSGSGITDSSGQFEYESGETIQFKIGNTLVGDAVTAKEALTTLDLISGAVLYTNSTQVNKVVYSHIKNPERTAFFRFHNVLTFLVSLDDDRDATNGINISTELAARFDDVSLDFYFDHTFLANQYYALGSRIQKAAFDGLIERGIVPSRGYALDQYYLINNIESYLAVSMVETSDALGDGSIELTNHKEYDGAGNYIRSAQYLEGVLQREERYTYGQWNERLSYSTDNDGDGIIDSSATYEYDDRGNSISSISYYDNDDATPANRFYMPSYDEYGNRTSVTTLTDPQESNGEVTYTSTTGSSVITRDENGREISIVGTQVGNALKRDTITTSYHSSGQIESQHILYTEGDTINHELLRTNTYDDNGSLLTKKVTRADGSSAESIYSYNDDLLLISESADTNYDGEFNYTRTHVYNEAGLPILSESLTGLDGDVTSSSAYTYDTNGNRLTQTITRPGSGDTVYTYQYDQHENRLNSVYFGSTQTYNPVTASWRAVLAQPKIQ